MPTQSHPILEFRFFFTFYKFNVVSVKVKIMKCGVSNIKIKKKNDRAPN